MFRKIALSVLVIGLVAGMGFQIGLAATQEEIEAAIELGIEWLVDQQDPDSGAWEYGEEIAPTGFAVLKLEDYAFEHDFSPFDPEYAYKNNVVAGFDYIFGQVQTDSSGVYFANTWGDHETYSTGIVMMTIVASQDPDRVVTTVGSAVEGWTYQEVVQACVDWFVTTQNPDGGWRYFGMADSDNSNTGYAVLGLRYAELFGCTIPGSLKTNLNNFVNYIQCAASGGSGYDLPCDWVNVLKTGNLLFEMAFLGDTMAVPRAQQALAYIEATWTNTDPQVGWRDPYQYQAMYCLMRGLGAMGIRTITVGGIDVDWYQAFADAILASQDPEGWWEGDIWAGRLLSTQWALLVLEYVIPPYEVTIDIKPGSFPNSINPDQNGTTPVAILSSEDFDAPALVDPASLTFGHTGDEDSLAYRGKKNPQPQVGYEDVNGDGLIDVVAHFVTNLCGFVKGDVLGHLKGETFDGLDIFGSDSVRIVPPNKPSAAPAAELPVVVFPNPISDVHTAYFRVAGPLAAEVTALRVRIFDLAGRLVWDQEIADNELAWHTDNLAGEYLANGVYLYRVQAKVAGVWISTDIGTIAILR